MNVNGTGGSTSTQSTHHTTTVGTQSGTQTAGTQTGAPEPTEDNVPVVGSAEETPSGDGSIPSPDTDPGAYAEYLDGMSDDYEDLMALREQLEFLAERGDAKAGELIGKIDAAIKSMGLGNDRALEDFQDALDEYGDYRLEADFDGDGIKNKLDADIDGDNVTNEAEIANGTNAYSIDTDGDGITDYGELWLKQHNYSYTWMDPNNPDANHDGIIDGTQLPSSVSVDNNGVPIKVGAQPGSGDTGGTDGASTSSASLQWGPPASDAQSASWGDTIPAGEGDVVLNLAGENIEVSTSADGKNMIVTNKDTGETITIEDYKSRKIYFEGSAGTISTNNFSSGNLTGTDSNGDGYADTGVHFASGMNTASIQNNYDPFNGSVPINEDLSTDDVTVYNTDSTSGTFTVPAEVDGQEVTSVIVTKGDFDGDGVEDVIVELKGSPEGPTLRKFVLRGGVDEVEGAVSGSGISFQLDDKGQYFYSEDVKVHVVGGKGDDYITGKSGSFIEGGDGSDVLRLSGTDGGGTIDGGRGDDYIEGSDGGNETLKGGEGEGMDLIMANGGASDTLDGGDGDDILVVSDPEARDDTVIGGGGQDMSNDISGGATGVEVDVSLTSFMEYLAQQTNEASGALLEELTNAGALTSTGQEAAAEAIANATSSLLSHKKAERYNSYGGTHDTDIPEPETEETEGA